MNSVYAIFSLYQNVFCYFFQTGNYNDDFNPLSANPTKWSNTLKQFVGKLPPNCLSVFVHFVGLALKGLRMLYVKDSQIKMAWNEN